MLSNKIFDAISESYGKYFITIQISGSEQYAVWGEDFTDDRNNKILLDEANNVMLFKSMPDALRNILKPSSVLFDSKNIMDWARACQTIQVSSSYTNDLDLIQFIITSDQLHHLLSSKREECWDVLTLLHLISDYAYQINDTYLLELYQGEPVSTFSDFVYDNHFWTISKEELAVHNDRMTWEPHYPQFKQDVIDLIKTFKSRLVYYS